jgi:bifunctional DNase/RNase
MHPRRGRMIEVGIKCVMREPLTSRYIILLESMAGLEILPIPVSEESANTIHSILSGCHKDDKNIFGLMHTIMKLYGDANPERVVIDGYEEGVFTAKVYIIVNGEEKIVDARPSDAVRFAITSEVPVYVQKHILFEKYGNKKLCFEKSRK